MPLPLLLRSRLYHSSADPRKAQPTQGCSRLERVPTRLTRRNRCLGVSLARLPHPGRRKRSGWKKAPPGLWRLRLRDRMRIRSSLGVCLTSARAMEAPAHRSTLEPCPETPIHLEVNWRRSPNHLLGLVLVHPGQGSTNRVQLSRLEKWTTFLSLRLRRHPSHSVPRSCPRLTLSAPVRQRAQLPSTSRRGLRVAKVHLGSRSANNSHP